MNVQEKVAEADLALASSKALHAKAILDELSQEKVDAAKAQVDEANEKLALLIYEHADFSELDCEYIHKYHKFDEYGSRVGNEITETVKMNIPRACMHNKTCKWEGQWYNGDWDTEAAAPIELPSDSSEQPVEHNGITPTQLRAVMANVRRRCVVEGWVNYKNEPLTPETVTLYDVAKYIILPYTVNSKKPFVRTLPSMAGDQPPRWFASHWWGEPIVAFIECIERLVIDFAPNDGDEDDRRGGGMTVHTPIWVCAYANNQWGLADDITEDPKDSTFTKAMQVAEYRTVSILDEGGETFKRIWCGFELALTFNAAEDGVWVVYTTHKHKYNYGEERQAIGIVSGGAPIDRGSAYRTAYREQHFPFSLIAQAPSIQIELAEASEELDRIHILNSIVNSEDLNGNPPTEHPKYNEINDALRARFVSTPDRVAKASKESDEVWKLFVAALSKGKVPIKQMVFSFNMNEWKGFTAERAIELAKNLPPTVRVLYIMNTEFGKEFVEAVVDCVERSTCMTSLSLTRTKAGGGEGQQVGERLADVMASNNTIIDLYLNGTDLIGPDNVEKWGEAMMANTTITRLQMDIGAEMDALKIRTEGRTPELNII